MGYSNDRFQEPNSVHHLVSRVAHKVFFLKDDERNDFLGMMRRVAEFSGIKLLGWCIMTNHFHILAYLPFREEISDEEVLRRYHILKGASAPDLTTPEDFDRMRARMYDLGEFMKTLKQWFTQEYNRRYSHVGTLWESVYHDKAVPMKVSDMVRVLAYIHLNPIRAAIATGFAEYQWSSLSSAQKGDADAINGLKFAYGCEDASVEELIAAHCDLMAELLEGIKRQRAEDIARKRTAGYDVPLDPITSEAYVAQAATHLKKVLDAGVEIKEEARRYQKSAAKREEIERRIVDVISANPKADVRELSAKLGVPQATIYRYLKDLQSRDIISRAHRNAPWVVCVANYHFQV